MRFLKDTRAQSHMTEIIIVLLFVVVAAIAVWQLFGAQIRVRLSEIMSQW